MTQKLTSADEDFSRFVYHTDPECHQLPQETKEVDPSEDNNTWRECIFCRYEMTGDGIDCPYETPGCCGPEASLAKRCPKCRQTAGD